MEMRVPDRSAGLPRARRSGCWCKDRDRGLLSTRLGRVTGARRSAVGASTSLWPAGRSRAERSRRGRWYRGGDASSGCTGSPRTGLGRNGPDVASGTSLAGGVEVARGPGSGALNGCSALAAFPAHSNRPSATRTQVRARTPRLRVAVFSRPLPESPGCSSLLRSSINPNVVISSRGRQNTPARRGGPESHPRGSLHGSGRVLSTCSRIAAYRSVPTAACFWHRVLSPGSRPVGGGRG